MWPLPRTGNRPAMATRPWRCPMASMLALGAAGVSVGTRFIACTEATIDDHYKNAVLSSTPEDIVLTRRLSGTAASVINTEYIQKMGLELPWYFRILKDQALTKKYIVPLIHFLGSKSLEEAATGPSWKTVWSAGQSVGLIDEILPCAKIMENFVNEYKAALESVPRLK